MKMDNVLIIWILHTYIKINNWFKFEIKFEVEITKMISPSVLTVPEIGFEML